MTDFDELYKVHEHPWGSKPKEEITYYASSLKPGTILDVGVGDGRNVLFLAQQGFSIVGLDISPLAIERLEEAAQRLAVSEKVRGIVSDITHFVPKQTYDNVMSHFALHFLAKEDSPRIMRLLQDSTAPNGLHIISDFTQNGPLYKPTTSKYWLKEGELKNWYKNWEILHYQEKKVKTRVQDENGKPYFQIAATVVAKKLAKIT